MSELTYDITQNYALVLVTQFAFYICLSIKGFISVACYIIQSVPYRNHLSVVYAVLHNPLYPSISISVKDGAGNELPPALYQAITRPQWSLFNNFPSIRTNINKNTRLFYSRNADLKKGEWWVVDSALLVWIWRNWFFSTSLKENN